MATKKRAQAKRATKTAPTKTAPKKQAPRKKAKATQKTLPTARSVDAFLARVDAARRDDVRVLDDLFRRVTGEAPRMWGPTIVGYGAYHYVYDSGREGDAPMSGFSPRKQNLTLYFVDGFDDRAAQLQQLGPHSLGKGCLYVKSLADVDLDVLERMVRASIAAVRARHPS